MARARILKPGFFKNEDLLECSMAARLLFAGLWTLADREGRLEDRPKKTKLEIFPGDDVDCDALLNELAERKFILRYQVKENKYIQILKFIEHQKPHKNEIASIIPNPEQSRKGAKSSGKGATHSGLNLNPDYLNLNPETPIPPEGDFEDWWKIYPHKIGKKAAEPAFAKAIRQANYRMLAEGVERYIRTKPPDRSYCNPATWLNQERWKDEPNETTGKNINGSNGKSRRAREVIAEAFLETHGQGNIESFSGGSIESG